MKKALNKLKEIETKKETVLVQSTIPKHLAQKIELIKAKHKETTGNSISTSLVIEAALNMFLDEE